MTIPVLNLESPALEATRDALPQRARRSGRELWREPLLHFLFVGGLLFALDRVLAPGHDEQHTIVIGPQVDRDVSGTFEAARGRKPDARELEALRKAWLDQELLYREGLALGVDKGDPAIRERVIFKALSLIDGEVKAPVVSDAELHAWFERHRDKYDEPARYDFEEAVLSNEHSEAAVRSFVEQLNSGTPGDAKAGLRVFKGRPRPTLLQSYGEAFTAALAAAELGHWRALPANDGWHAVRLNGASPPKPGVFESLRAVVLQDFRDAHGAEQRTQAVRALAKKYTISYETER